MRRKERAIENALDAVIQIISLVIVQKPPRNKDQKDFIGGSWSDSENEAEDKNNDETCLMAQSSNELDKDISVADKMNGPRSFTFRRPIRGGIESQQMDSLNDLLQTIVLSDSNDRWVCDLAGDGSFCVKDIRNRIDDVILPSTPIPTRWLKIIPIKVNIFMWRARLGCLPTRDNLVRRGVLVDSTACPSCSVNEESVNHTLFCCDLARTVLQRICRWWNLALLD
ncbi:RNA-directed DNA polymerase, eukaryota [Tanacetum coccineum]